MYLLEQITNFLGIDPAGITLDSRNVKDNFIFIAIQGHSTDGHKYIENAIKQGAILIFCEDFNKISSLTNHIELEHSFAFVDTIIRLNDNNVVIIAMRDLKLNISQIAGDFYQHPSEHITLIGVTGTNGKTTTTYLITQALAILTGKAALLGTVGNGSIESYNDTLQYNLQTSKNTTIEQLALQAALQCFLQEHLHYVTMEVSSHGIHQHRVNALKFDIAIWTNVTHDHLDYHKDFAEYIDVKASFMDFAPTQIVNIDDENIRKWLHKFKTINEISMLQLSPITFGLDAKTADIYPLEYKLTNDGIDAVVINKRLIDDNQLYIKSQLLGKFNLYNLLVTVAVLQELGFARKDIESTLPALTPPPGRMQLIQEQNKPKVIVDYAHTPDALQQILQSLKEQMSGKILCVFGCGGDRDKNKRPIMASIAECYSDFIIVTSDNPRTEKQTEITEDIIRGFSDRASYLVEENREKAIAEAIKMANTEDVVVIAGKGHEVYQEINGVKEHFNDAEIARLYLSKYM